MPPLTKREIEAVSDLSRGLTASESAARIGVSTRTIEFHLKNARRKLGAKTSAHLVGLVAQVDIQRLRQALIDTGNNLGGGVGGSVSTDFLMHVPEEARLVVGRLTEEIEKWKRAAGVA